MSGFIPPVETNIAAPTTEELLGKFDAEREARHLGHIVLPEEFVGPLRPDTLEEAEERAKLAAQARLDFQLAWDNHEVEQKVQAERAKREAVMRLAPVVSIIKSRIYAVGSLASGQLMRRAS